jgi:hypothetical protein
MIDRDIWLAANELIKLYGDDAAVQAAIRAEASHEQGDEHGYAVWNWILGAIGELKCAKPTGFVN